MDAVYGTKRYLRSLIGTGSDIYGSPNSRITHNEINNSYGYRSAMSQSDLHPSKYPYYNDFSQPNQFGYNNWGIWREQSIAPSVYSAKSRNEVKSFSIILSTAAFIVILAVISVAGLAFYFGTFKSNLDEPVMMFEGSFHIMKGDVYTTALKYNHSSTYKQKVDFYGSFIEKSLKNNNLQPVKVEILGFGDGPLINTNFRVFLDIRKIPINIRSVEEHVREAIILQTNSLKSLYKTIRVDPDTFTVKRVLDDEKIKSALFIMANTQEDFPKNLSKTKPALIKSPSLITTVRSKVIKPTAISVPEELTNTVADSDHADNVPAVASNSFEGSFEITKTDADITRKKIVPTKAVASKKTAQTTARLNSKVKPTVEKVYKSPINTTLSMLVKPAAIINDGLKPTTSPTTTTSATTKRTTTPLTLRETTKIITTTGTRTTVRRIGMTKITPKIRNTLATTAVTKKQFPKFNFTTTAYNSALSRIVALNEEISHLNATNKAENLPLETREDFDPPKLDVHLFTTSPVLDTEPWRPIRPPMPTTPPLIAETSSILSPKLNLDKQKTTNHDHLILNIRNKTDTTSTKDSDLIFYQSFTNPVFMPGLSGIEKLGNSVVKPHPIPVQLLDDVVTPDYKISQQDDSMLQALLRESEANQHMFEEIGGGVMRRKPNNSDRTQTTQMNLSNISITTPKTTETEISKNQSTSKPDKNIETDKQKIDEINTKNSQVSPAQKESGKFNLLPHRSRKNDSLTIIELNDRKGQNYTEVWLKDTESRNKESTITALDFNSAKDSIKTEILNSSLLFPTKTKWEYINSTVEKKPSPSSVKKIFNETLHAWVVRDGPEEEKKTFSSTIALKNDLNADNRPKVNIQDIAHIFDTLASKLGISSATYSRRPPFPASRLKQSSRIDTWTPTTSTVVAPTTSTTQIASFASDDSTVPADSEEFLPIILSTENPSERSKETINDSSLEKSEGEAEIEVVDPNIYDEILRYSQVLSSSTEATVPTLMTLLPVKSNSGIRPLNTVQLAGLNVEHSESENERSYMNTNFKEATVRDTISVTN